MSWFDCCRPSNRSVLEFTTTRSTVFPKTLTLSSLSGLIFNFTCPAFCLGRLKQYQWCPEARLGGGYSEDGASDISLDTSLLVARLRGGELKPKGEGNHKNFDMSVNYDSEVRQSTFR